ncbi:glycosyltransferase family 2 protein [Photobacterium satsumensis]|uniref:glycosyltransferase family 2 protein n=1 Tax=Photobacterium satsumensis TaxID=2910239 RepID=UPI003D0C6907
MTTVSVIIPTYNCVEYLPRALGSVLSQTHVDFEVIIVDDNSSDETQAYLSHLFDKRIKVLKTTGVGASEARNVGIRESSNDFIAFLDADDFWVEEKLKTQLVFHSHYPNIAMSFTNYDHLNEQYQPIIDCFSYWHQFQDEKDEYVFLDNPLEFILGNNIIGTSTVMVKRNVLVQLKMFNPHTSYAEDWELWLRISEKYDIGIINAIQTGYLMRKGSTTQTDTHRLDNLQSIESIISRYQRAKSKWNISSTSFDKAHARVLEGYAEHHRGMNHYATAIWFGLRALRLAPDKRKLRSLLGDFRKLTHSFSLRRV